MKTKTIAMIMATLMLLVGMISGTLAWLVDSTKEVNNVFTTADIGVTLTETFNAKSDESEVENDIWTAQLIPGFTYKKDPTVTVSDDSVDCYLFVKFEEENTPSTYLTYTSTLTKDNGWTQGDGTGIPDNVWYRKVKTTDELRSWELLSGKHEDECVKDGSCTCTYAHGFVTVNDSLKKETMNAEGFKAPELVYTAYAFQLYKDADEEFDAEVAWAKAQKNEGSSSSSTTTK